MPFDLFDIDIFSASENELREMSSELGLNLSLEEMHHVRSYFKKLDRSPTDVEVQSIAQAWSEHCCYKSSKVFLREHVFNIKHDEVLSKGDAGVMVFDEEYGYALRIESHNHPSAIEPYGGAATGIGGIVRDVLCMGAQPIALVDPLFFGPLDHKGDLPSGVKSPVYLMGGVVAGIRDYGNRIGIPTVAGGIWFDPSYLGNCLVNVGCVGIVKRSELVRNAVRGTGDVMILCGGRTGRDGIHGVTFASAELHEASEEESRGAVQLGDPITKEPLIHACLEVNSRGLVHGMKDLGGGGLSCVVGEMALSGGCGAIVHLERVPLKEAGLAPWEIWVSESQERMMIAAAQEDVEAILEVFALWDVDATVIGEVVPGNEVTIYNHGEKVFQVDLDFLTKGPEYCRPCLVRSPSSRHHESIPSLPSDLSKVLLRLLSDPNIASKEWVVRQYDHEVRGGTVIKPLSGKMNLRGPSDATVHQAPVALLPGLGHLGGREPMVHIPRPVPGRSHLGGRGLPQHRGGGRASAFAVQLPELRQSRETGPVGRAQGSGGRPGGGLHGHEPGHPFRQRVTLQRDRRRTLPAHRHRDGIGHSGGRAALRHHRPQAGGRPDLPGGRTARHFGGSALFRVFGGKGGEVPDVDTSLLRNSSQGLNACMADGMVKACHDLLRRRDGGGDGRDVHRRRCRRRAGPERDGAEGPHRSSCSANRTPAGWSRSTRAGRRSSSQRLGVPALRIGEVGGDELRIMNDGLVLRSDVTELRQRWSSPLWDLLG